MFGGISSAISAASPIAASFASCSSSSDGRNSELPLPCLPLASRIVVRNLSFSTGEASLIKLFSKFGPIIEVKVAKHEETKRSKGYAFIQYSCQDDAILAIEHMDHMRIDGRIVSADIAKPVNKGFGAYPRSSGPPPPQNPQANAVGDHICGDSMEVDQV